MIDLHLPLWLRHAPGPARQLSIRGFAILAGFEAMTRGMLISVFPVALYAALQDAALVSSIYFATGLVSLITGLSVPFLNRFIPRRWMYGIGGGCFVASSLAASTGIPSLLVAGLVLNSMAAVITFVCFNAYVMDYITRANLGRLESQRMVFSGFGWTVGPFLGVVLWGWWAPAPFLISGLSAALMVAAFTLMRMGNGKLITRARKPAPNPLAYLGRFAAQPRLIAGWLFAVIRSCGWWAYVVYLPIYAVENGMAEQLGGALLSVTNAALFSAPLLLRAMQAYSIRTTVRAGFLAVALLFGLAGTGVVPPVVAVGSLFVGSFFLILLDICANLPFLMAVKPSERTEMSAVFSSFRDVSGIATPGVAWLVLLVAPISGVFAASGLACLVAWGIAGRLHPRLGAARLGAAPRQPDAVPPVSGQTPSDPPAAVRPLSDPAGPALAAPDL